MSYSHRRHNSDSALVGVHSRVLLQTASNGVRVPLYTSTFDLIDRQLGWPRGRRARAAFVVNPVSQWYPIPPPSFTVPRRNSLPRWWSPAEFTTMLTTTHLSVSNLSQAVQARRQVQEPSSQRLAFYFPRPSTSINPRLTDSLYIPPNASGAPARLSRPAERVSSPRAAQEPRTDSAQPERARSFQWRFNTLQRGQNGTNLRHRSLGPRRALPLDSTDPPAIQELVDSILISDRPLLSENESSPNSPDGGVWMAETRRGFQASESMVDGSASTIPTNRSLLRPLTFDDRPVSEPAVGRSAHTAPSSLFQPTAPNINDRPVASPRTRRRQYESTGEDFIWQPTSTLLLGSWDSDGRKSPNQEPIDPSIFEDFDWAHRDPALSNTLNTSDHDLYEASQPAHHVNPMATSPSDHVRQELATGTLAQLTESVASLLAEDQIAQTQQGGWHLIEPSLNLDDQVGGTPRVEEQSYLAAALLGRPVGLPFPQMQLGSPQMHRGFVLGDGTSDSTSDGTSDEDSIPELQLGPPHMQRDLVLGDSTGDSSDSGDVPSSLMYEHSNPSRNSAEVSPHRQDISSEEDGISRIDWARPVERPHLERRNAVWDFSRRGSSAPTSAPVWPPNEPATVAAISNAVRLDSVSQPVEQAATNKVESEHGEYNGEVGMFEMED